MPRHTIFPFHPIRENRRGPIRGCRSPPWPESVDHHSYARSISVDALGPFYDDLGGNPGPLTKKRQLLISLSIASGIFNARAKERREERKDKDNL